MLEEHAFDPAIHDRAGFTCGEPELDGYLHRFAAQHRQKGISTVFVLTNPTAPRFILGYHTLSAAQMDTASLSDVDRKKLPRYPVPCFRMGRLACHADHQSQGLGKLLVACAVGRCLQAVKQVAAFSLIVDAKNPAAKQFYQHYGFTACADSPMTLYLPLGSPPG